MRWVRNLATGRVHDVPEGHYALASVEFEAVPEPDAAPDPTPETTPVPKTRGRSRARS